MYLSCVYCAYFVVGVFKILETTAAGMLSFNAFEVQACRVTASKASWHFIPQRHFCSTLSHLRRVCVNVTFLFPGRRRFRFV